MVGRTVNFVLLVISEKLDCRNDNCMELSAHNQGTYIYSLSHLANLVEFFTIAQNWQCWYYCQLCIPICLQLSSLFAPTDINKLEIRNQGTHEDYFQGCMLYWAS